MSFLSFLGFQKAVEDGVKALDPTPKKEQDVPKPVARKSKVEYKEHYRVGRTTDGMTTLTLLIDGGYSSTTLTMNQEACEHLIRMLQSTFDLKQPAEETQQ